MSPRRHQTKTRISRRKETSENASPQFAAPPVIQPKIQRKIERELPEWKPGGSGKPSPLQRLQPSATLQAKLEIGQPSDPYEQQANTVARDVVEQINTPVSNDAQQHTTVQRQTQESNLLLRLKPTGQQSTLGGGKAPTQLESSINHAKSGGKFLEPSLQRSMGKAMGVDFSGVKIHTDAQANQLSESIQAKAFTTGQNIFFKQGEYQPQNRGGQELIAHELTHVVQQQRENITLPQIKARPTREKGTTQPLIQRRISKALLPQEIDVRQHEIVKKDGTIEQGRPVKKNKIALKEWILSKNFFDILTGLGLAPADDKEKNDTIKMRIENTRDWLKNIPEEHKRVVIYLGYVTSYQATGFFVKYRKDLMRQSLIDRFNRIGYVRGDVNSNMMNSNMITDGFVSDFIEDCLKLRKTLDKKQLDINQITEIENLKEYDKKGEQLIESVENGPEKVGSFSQEIDNIKQQGNETKAAVTEMDSDIAEVKQENKNIELLPETNTGTALNTNLPSQSIEVPTVSIGLTPKGQTAKEKLDALMNSILNTLGIGHLRDGYKGYKKYKTREKEEKQFIELAKSTDVDKATTGVYSAAKIARSKYETLFQAICNIAQGVCRVLSLIAPVVSVFTEIIKFATGIISSLPDVYHFAKGIWKILRGTKGANRTAHADSLVKEAIQEAKGQDNTICIETIYTLFEKKLKKKPPQPVVMVQMKSYFENQDTLKQAFADPQKLGNFDSNMVKIMRHEIFNKLSSKSV